MKIKTPNVQKESKSNTNSIVQYRDCNTIGDLNKNYAQRDYDLLNSLLLFIGTEINSKVGELQKKDEVLESTLADIINNISLSAKNRRNRGDDIECDHVEEIDSLTNAIQYSSK